MADFTLILDKNADTVDWNRLTGYSSLFDQDELYVELKQELNPD